MISHPTSEMPAI